jgi:hypothetical protein
MSYGLIYKVSIPSLRKNNYSLEIEKKDYAGSSSILMGGAEPFTTTLDDDDFIYLPLRLSTGKLSVVGGSALSSLFATEYQEYRVTLYKDTTPIWCGFIKPELYTQDYTAVVHEINIDCLSAMQTLEYVKYTQINLEGLKFVSLKSLISRAVAATNAKYQKVYMPHTFAASQAAYGTNALMQDDCVISEQNFFDEENKPMSYKDILEEICRFAHVTLYDDGGSLYFVDHDYTDAYDEWTLTDGTFVLATANALTIGMHSVQDIGFGGTDHSLDIIAGYNKATVKASNYNNSEKVFPEEDWDSLTLLQDLTGHHEAFVSASETDDIYYRRRMLEGDVLKPHYYKGLGVDANGHPTKEQSLSTYWPTNYGDIFEEVEEVSTPQKYMYHTGYPEDLNYGTYMAKYDSYRESNKPINYNYEDVILLHKYMLDDGSGRRVTFDPTKHSGLLTYRRHLTTAAFSDGAIILSLQSRVISRDYNMLYSPDAYETWWTEKGKLKFTFMLRIGDSYYNGTSWVASSATFQLESEEIDSSTSFVALRSNKTLGMPYNGATGYIIPITGTLKGEVFFAIMDVSENCAVKDFKLEFQVSDDYVTVQKSNSKSSDRIYSNVVNADYINELDEIEEKISSYNHDGLCYSKVLLGDDFISDGLYEGINKVVTRPENLLLRRIVNQYEYPKIKLTQVLMNDISVLPIDKITDTYQGTGKKFVLTGKETKYRSDTSEIKMIEKV